MMGTSWMQKNTKFVTPVMMQQMQDQAQQNQQQEQQQQAPPRRQPPPNRNGSASRQGDDDSRPSSSAFTSGNTDTFRTTRVFVEGIPDGVSWQTLKDHFRDSMEDSQVVFASVSVDPETGRSKGHGIVQFETPD
eukprot:CAMPEP_0119568228 /NCGR_PEP_ID=MMETSP1352-20130426/38281_1 /TAXON_ID=265584 /ORGANISM="Stauroneis constricta, Strain CCMP1120" /LENGTH=133 /DNA_ID=CAMNT_0007617591 /DNA_START=6 /DNA_END=404 /DNA_ORIENTATION=-